ncbi:DUF2589 domain-containing protein [Paraneptunicella aestuarii]|uniref:DUF2589 domain-containing protein n=1 Tax=Paraneptunicella aestuarii TaxID=2831148 RepID=UPI001E347E9B|nr:DUF2589 domain-containing protein [Paraneptunicella aestuarii]UAA39176.1 DUF2589 domain-containing protein [Paraneptunicella aestuarii]
MASANLSLQNLVEAIMNSIADAQDQIERQTLDNIYEWFDENGRPKMVSFRVPAFGPDADQKRARGEIAEREINVPMLTLMQNNPIKIKRLVSKFEIALGGVELQEQDVSGANTGLGAQAGQRIKKILSTDLFTGDSKRRSRTASMEIEFESGEPTEAYLKLQNELLKLF